MRRNINMSGLTPWKPGQSGNLAGRAGTLPPEIRAERKKNQAALIRLITELFMLPEDKAKERAEQPNAPQITVVVQGLISKSKEGNHNAFKALIEIMVGKIPEHDYDGYTEEDLRILNRVKEVFAEEQYQVEHGPD